MSTPSLDDDVTVQGSENCLAIGTRLAEFEITGIIGEGGFGIVYLAFDHSLQRTVALKEYMPGVMAGRNGDQSVLVRSKRHQEAFDTGLRSFINEARLLAQFDHPALIKIHRFWEQNNTGYMAMRYYEGKNLKRILQDHPKFATQSRLRVMLQSLLEALEALYKVQVLHRDISPENIMILKSGEAVLLDFGAARQIISDMTQALTVILKPGYAPIEQYADDPSMQQGPWTDIYSLSAVMFVAITGKAPPSSVARMIKDPVARLADGNYPGFQRDFLHAIDQGLAVRPEDRPQSIAAFRALLGIVPDGTAATPTTPPIAKTASTAAPVPFAEQEARQRARPEPHEKNTNRRRQRPSPAGDIQPMTQPMPPSMMREADGTQRNQRTQGTPRTRDPKAASTATTAPTFDKRRWLLLGLAAVLLIGAIAGYRGSRKAPAADTAQAAAAAAGMTQGEQLLDEETVAWETLNQRPNPTTDDITGFIAKFPNGKLVDKARARLATLDARASISTASAASPAVTVAPAAVAPVPVATASTPTAPLADKSNAERPAEPETTTGTVALSIKPWGTVTVDGVDKGVSPPLKRLVVTEGRHRIKIVNPNFPERVIELDVVRKKTAHASIDFAPGSK